jgi:flagellar basal body rod protein FlgG
MLAAYRVSAKGLTAELLRHEVLANNLANSRTSGFQADQVIVRGAPAGGTSPGLPAPEVAGTFTRPEVAAVRRTDNPLDFAVRGDGYFVVTTPAGPRLTRSGAFSLGPDGALVNAAGYPVEGDGGPLSTTASRIQVTAAGDVLGDGASVGRLAIRAVKPGAVLVKTPDGFLQTLGGEADLQPAAKYEVLQGFVEDSSVEPIHEMIEMINAFRAYEAGIKTIQAADDVLRTTTDRLGRLA